MDKPSHPSVYSTAAILAAFSRASASGDDAACQDLPHAAMVGPSVLDACASMIQRWSKVLPRSASPSAHRLPCKTDRDPVPCAQNTSRLCVGRPAPGDAVHSCSEAHRLVTSHFAFSDRRDVEPDCG